MSFPTFFLHFCTKELKVHGITRDQTTEGDYVIAIALDEQTTRKLLNGEIHETNLIVNHYAEPPYVIDKTNFPDQDFFVTYQNSDLQITQLSTSIDKASLSANDLSFIKVNEIIAFSILTSETSYNDWEIKFTKSQEPYVTLKDTHSSLKSSSLFSARTDYLSLVEIDVKAEKDQEKTGLPLLAKISFDHHLNEVTIQSESLKSTEVFEDFSIAITKKGDPSFLIRLVKIENGKLQKIFFGNNQLSDFSFFSSKFHIRNCKIVVKSLKNETINISKNDFQLTVEYLSDQELEQTVILHDKFDLSQVYSAHRLTPNSTTKINILEFNDLGISIPNIPKHLIKFTGF